MSEDRYSDIFFERATYALVIGVSTYLNGYEPGGEASAEKFSNLKFAADDAERFRTFLQNHGVNNVICLKDKEAQLANIHDAFHELSTWCARAQNPLVIVFFSGHGWVDEREWKYLLPHDADKKKLYRTGLNNRDFIAWVNQLQTELLVIFLDACHAGYFGQEEGSKGEPSGEGNISQYDYRELGEGKGRVILASCGPDKKSYEFSQPLDPSCRSFNNGIFTGCLLDLLEYETEKWEDEYITTLNLFDRLTKKMQEYHKVQRPYITNQGESIVLAINKRVREQKKQEDQRVRTQQIEAEKRLLAQKRAYLKAIIDCGLIKILPVTKVLALYVEGVKAIDRYRELYRYFDFYAQAWLPESDLEEACLIFDDCYSGANQKAPGAAQAPAAEASAISQTNDRIETIAVSPGLSSAPRSTNPSVRQELREASEEAPDNVLSLRVRRGDNGPV